MKLIVQILVGIAAIWLAWHLLGFVFGLIGFTFVLGSILIRLAITALVVVFLVGLIRRLLVRV